MEPTELLSDLALGFGITAALLLILRKIAFRIDLLDRPDARKQHQGAVPLVGGLGIFAGFALTCLLLDIPLGAYRGLFAGGMILVLVGVLDDLHDLSPKARFIAQGLAALIMVYWGGVELKDLGHLIPGSDEPLQLAWVCVPFTVFATVGVINALNMIDGVDGLAGSVVMNALLGMALLAWFNGDTADTEMLLLIGSAVLAFLSFNWRFKLNRPPLMFLGDAGSLLLGFTLTWFLIKLSQGPHRAMTPTTALWLMAVPLIDTIVMMARRIRKGRSPFSADREHFHHVLQYAGFNPREAVFLILGVSITLAAVGTAGQHYGIPEYLMLALFLGVFAAYYQMIMRSWKLMRFLKRSICRRRSRDRRSNPDRRRQQIDWVGPERRQIQDRRMQDRRGNNDSASIYNQPSATISLKAEK